MCRRPKERKVRWKCPQHAFAKAIASVSAVPGLIICVIGALGLTGNLQLAATPSASSNVGLFFIAFGSFLALSCAYYTILLVPDHKDDEDNEDEDEPVVSIQVSVSKTCSKLESMRHGSHTEPDQFLQYIEM